MAYLAPSLAENLLGMAMALTAAQHRAAMMDLRIAHITNPAENRMRERTAKEQLAAAMAASASERKPAEFPAPDDADDASLRINMLT